MEHAMDQMMAFTCKRENKVNPEAIVVARNRNDVMKLLEMSVHDFAKEDSWCIQPLPTGVAAAYILK